MHILIAHGVNLDLLGTREPGLYGNVTLDTIHESLSRDVEKMAHLWNGLSPLLTFFQTNREHEFLEKISEPYDGVLMNPGAWTHTSLALADRLRGLRIPFVEVHISNLAARENFRHTSYAAPYAAGVVYGFGADSYRVGLFGLLSFLFNRRQNGNTSS